MSEQYSQPLPPLAYESAAFGDPRDRKHIGILVVMTYIWGGLGLAFSTLWIIDIVLGVMMLNGVFRAGVTPAQSRQMGWLLIIMFSILVVLGYAVSALNLYSARCMQKRRNRTFSLVMAGMNCVVVPFGTVLGVFTFIVLLRESVTPLYPLDGKSQP